MIRERRGQPATLNTQGTRGFSTSEHDCTRGPPARAPPARPHAAGSLALAGARRRRGTHNFFAGRVRSLVVAAAATRVGVVVSIEHAVSRTRMHRGPGGRIARSATTTVPHALTRRARASGRGRRTTETACAHARNPIGISTAMCAAPPPAPSSSSSYPLVRPRQEGSGAASPAAPARAPFVLGHSIRHYYSSDDGPWSRDAWVALIEAGKYPWPLAGGRAIERRTISRACCY